MPLGFIPTERLMKKRKRTVMGRAAPQGPSAPRTTMQVSLTRSLLNMFPQNKRRNAETETESLNVLICQNPKRLEVIQQTEGCAMGSFELL